MSHTQEYTREASKGKIVSDCVVGRITSGTAAELGVKWIGEERKLEAPNLAMMSHSSKGKGHVSITRKE